MFNKLHTPKKANIIKILCTLDAFVNIFSKHKYISFVSVFYNPQHWLARCCLVFLFWGQISQDVSSITGDIHVYIIFYKKWPRFKNFKLIKIIVALDSAHVRIDPKSHNSTWHVELLKKKKQPIFNQDCSTHQGDFQGGPENVFK